MLSYTREQLRLHTVITSVWRGLDRDHMTHTVRIGVGEPNDAQCFGNVCLDSDAETALFLQEICATFGVADPERLIGQSCVALYSEAPSLPIEGLEAPSGKRFTLRGWRLRHCPEHAHTPKERKAMETMRTIAFLERQLADLKHHLANIPDIIDWETAP